jgi:hypothetical protein
MLWSPCQDHHAEITMLIIGKLVSGARSCTTAVQAAICRKFCCEDGVYIYVIEPPAALQYDTVIPS